MNLRAYLIAFVIVLSPSHAQEVYKHKDKDGNWVFSDKKSPTAEEVEKKRFTAKKKSTIKPRVYPNKNGDSYSIIAENPFFAPLEIEIRFPELDTVLDRNVIPPDSTTTIYNSNEPIPKFRYRWLLGDPNSKADNYLYSIPYISNQPLLISQAFGGKFSHYNEYNFYAVDFNMQIGTYLCAAREGMVLKVKDDYHMGGKMKFFLDKGNFISIYHSDGTIAKYYHILEGTALVKPGDKVNVGDIIARSGSSGLSGTPHLHFSVSKNVGMKIISIPFLFVDNNGKSFTPKKGMHVTGFNK